MLSVKHCFRFNFVSLRPKKLIKNFFFLKSLYFTQKPCRKLALYKVKMGEIFIKSIFGLSILHFSNCVNSPWYIFLQLLQCIFPVGCSVALTCFGVSNVYPGYLDDVYISGLLYDSGSILFFTLQNEFETHQLQNK